MTASLEVKNVVKSYGGKVVIDSLSFIAEPGEFIVLVGPSGCGKSTMLRSIAGLEDISSGSIVIDGKDVSKLPPKDRDIAMVFQDYALYPHKTVYENIAFGLRIRKVSETEIDRLVRDAAGKLSLTELLDRKPAALSGGQRQRVAIGRAIVRKPKIFLFDEPLSNLDAKLRTTMRATISQLHAMLGATAVYVTHDQVEAMTLASRIIVLEGGKVQQIGTPLQLYYHPANRFVAQFIGSPSMALINGKLSLKPSPEFVSDSGIRLPLLKRYHAVVAERGKDNQAVQWGIRPENFTIATDADSIIFKVQVVLTEPLGAHTNTLIRLGDDELMVSIPEPHRPKKGDTLSLAFTSSHNYLFDRDSGLALTD
jgi:multiple sugar transport system ATP-binding protein